MLYDELEMEPDANQDRQQAHDLLDMLPAAKIAAVRNLLEVMVEPLAQALEAAAIEEHELTGETVAALERSRESLARGEGIPHEQVLSDVGFTR